MAVCFYCCCFVFLISCIVFGVLETGTICDEVQMGCLGI